jgi:hypothetical protein
MERRDVCCIITHKSQLVIEKTLSMKRVTSTTYRLNGSLGMEFIYMTNFF